LGYFDQFSRVCLPVDVRFAQKATLEANGDRFKRVETAYQRMIQALNGRLESCATN
jgi:hypothetical protein